MAKQIQRKNETNHWVKRKQPVFSQIFFLKTAEILQIQINDKSEYEEYGLLPVKGQWIKEAERCFPWLKGYPYVVIHSGSGGVAKRWKLENFLGLVDFFAEKGIGGIFITGPAEGSYVPLLSAYRWADNWSWAHEPSLEVICGLLSRARLYIGNDSGVTHLAAFCGCSGLAFFRQENFPVWSPYTEKIKIIVAPELEQIGVDSVVEKIQELLGQRREG